MSVPAKLVHWKTMTQGKTAKVKGFHTGKAYLISIALPNLVQGSRKYWFFIYFYITGIDSKETSILNAERGEGLIFYLGKAGTSQNFTVLVYHFQEAMIVFNKLGVRYEIIIKYAVEKDIC